MRKQAFELNDWKPLICYMLVQMTPWLLSRYEAQIIWNDDVTNRVWFMVLVVFPDFCCYCYKWQCSKLKQLAEANSGLTKTLVYNVQAMMSMVNQTRYYVQETRADINAIKHMEVLVGDVQLVSDNLSDENCNKCFDPMTGEWVNKFNDLSGDSRHRGPCSPYKPCNYSLYNTLESLSSIT